MKYLINIFFVLLLMSHCVHRSMKDTPTRNEAIEQYKQVKALQEVYDFTRDRRTKQQIKHKIDSINNIKNPYK